MNCILAFRGWQPNEVGSNRCVSYVTGTRWTSEYFCWFLMCFTATATLYLRQNIIIWAKWGQQYGLTVSCLRNGFVCSHMLSQWLSTHLALPPTSSNSKSLLYKNTAGAMWCTMYMRIQKSSGVKCTHMCGLPVWKTWTFWVHNKVLLITKQSVCVRLPACTLLYHTLYTQNAHRELSTNWLHSHIVTESSSCLHMNTMLLYILNTVATTTPHTTPH